MHQKSCVVLCGGKSRRMGQDKGAMIFNDEPMVVSILKKVCNYIDDLVLVLRNQEQLDLYVDILKQYDDYFNLPIKLVMDDVQNQGPLMGIKVGLENIDNEYSLVLPCDSPFVNNKFIENIFNEKENNICDAVIPRWDNGNIEPLHAIYSKHSKDLIEDLLLNGIHDVKSLILKLNTIFIRTDILDSSLDTYKNLNKPEDVYQNQD